jgi:hypothetical protein
LLIKDFINSIINHHFLPQLSYKIKIFKLQHQADHQKLKIHFRMGGGTVSSSSHNGQSSFHNAVFSSNLGQDFGYAGRVFHGFPQFLQANAGTVPHIRPWLLPFKSFLIH